MKKQYNIAISCIGSGVGQSVINSCRLSNLPLKTIGFGTNPMAFGMYDCDEYIYTPNIYSKNYIDELIKICLENKIDLIIPGMDDEAHIFSKNIKKFSEVNIKVIVASEEILSLCRDKELMSNELNKVAPVFVKSYSKQGFIESLNKGLVTLPVIAKPRDGFASRGIEIINTKEDINRITDVHIVQELAIPHKNDPERAYCEKQLSKNINPQVAEISIQVVADQNSKILGQMVSYNKLNNGVPIEVLPFENKIIWEEVNKLLPTFQKLGLKGPFNLQGRITDDGLKLFELNARFTGITGLRAYMGFNEVELCIRSWLGLPLKTSTLKMNENKFGIRQTADKTVDLRKNDRVRALSNLINGKNLSTTKRILITGATGYLGRNLISELVKKDHSDLNIWALVRDKEEAKLKLPASVILFDMQDFDDGTLSMGNVDVLLHAAFARPFCNDQNIADSIGFSGKILRKAVSNQVGAIINISSQSVYGQVNSPPWNEKTSVVSPNSVYGMAKYSIENLLEQLAYQHKQINYTSIRLGAITGGAKGLVDVDVFAKLVKNTLAHKDMRIEGGHQIIARLDINDAVSGLVCLMNNVDKPWDKVYNIGASNSIKLKDLGVKVIETVSKLTQTKAVNMLIEDKKVEGQNFGLDISSFTNQFNWKPKKSIDDTLLSLVDFYKN